MIPLMRACVRACVRARARARVCVCVCVCVCECPKYLVYLTRKKEMFYLTTHSPHFILRLYGVGHMVKDHSDSERGNPLPPHGLHSD